MRLWKECVCVKKGMSTIVRFVCASTHHSRERSNVKLLQKIVFFLLPGFITCCDNYLTVFENSGAIFIV